MNGTFVLVGCGAAKADEPRPAGELYTSNYFALKRRYAEAATAWAGDKQSSAWAILSAEHGVIAPTIETEPYDTTVDDLDGDDLDAWADRVRSGLTGWLNWPFASDNDPRESPCGRLVVLAGERYVEPLEARDAFRGNVGGGAGNSRPGLPCVPEFPFREHDFDGIGEQMAWLKERAAAIDAPTEADTLASVGGGYERQRAKWRLDVRPINIEKSEQASLQQFEDVPDSVIATEQQTLVADGGDR
ncbi:DUF6884 domain-containing protein [Halobellus ordinarius]|uniref:DUF6884 domain-containing protein n=1 Tax=Halobellus ordinarius TaxID=3075120 RepID=UPI002880A057|nr:DUF6884 domain-containing protein [Halobellus sp. ZY16]